MVLTQPGVGVDLHHLPATALAGHGALPVQGPKHLGDEGQGADAAPDLMAEGHQDQQAGGHHHPPENLVALPAVAFEQQAAVVDVERPGIEVRNQEADDQPQPTEQEHPTGQVGLAFGPGTKQLQAIRSAGLDRSLRYLDHRGA
jgi:hypothetical protein